MTVGGVLVTMKPQQCNSVVSMQRQHQQNNRIVEQQLVLPSTTTTTAGPVHTTTMICHDKKDSENGHDRVVNDETVVKQVMHTQVFYNLIMLMLQPRVTRDFTVH